MQKKTKAQLYKEKIERYVEEYQSKVDRILASGRITTYHSGKTDLDYARERVEIWEGFHATL